MKKYNYLIYSLFITLGLFLGWLLFHPAKKEGEQKHEHKVEAGKHTIWTCAMHPQIRMEEPGKCPICGMDLIPLNTSGSQVIDPDAIHFTNEASQLANVMTSVVSKQKPVKEIRLYGKVKADERLLQSQVAHFPGRIEKLMLNFTGEGVKKGQTLAYIYSPELITAQQEFIEASKSRETQAEIYEAAKERLRQWKISESQINTIEASGSIKNEFEIKANTTGIVIARRVNNGDHVTEGTVLYEIADLSHVWVMFDAYESDLPFINEGDLMTFNVQAIPGKNFKGKIIFIDPVIDPTTRVSRVRVEIANESGKLKPEMFVTGLVESQLNEYQGNFIIPKSAILWTGKRSLVYVKQTASSEPIFKVREIELGPSLGSSYVVLNGLQEGEEIVTQGTFSVDAAAQLEGKPSMMNTEFTSNSGIEPKESHKVSSDFKIQLTKAFEKYIILKDALVKSDATLAKKAVQDFNRSLSQINETQIPEDLQGKWADYLEEMMKATDGIEMAKTLEQQRLAFAELSDVLYHTIKIYGLAGLKVYYQFCPMANNEKGAYWLSKDEAIRNPYFGESMLTCGETKETITF